METITCYGAFSVNHFFASQAVRRLKRILNNRQSYYFLLEFTHRIEEMYVSKSPGGRKDFKKSLKSDKFIAEIAYDVAFNAIIHTTFYTNPNSSIHAATCDIKGYYDMFLLTNYYLYNNGYITESEAKRHVSLVSIATNIFTSPDGERLDFEGYADKTIPEYFKQFIKQ